MGRLLRLTLATLLFAALASVALTLRSAHGFCLQCDVPQVIEYRNAVTGHYLLLPDGDPEVAFVEGGGAGPGWERTGNDFTESSLPGTIPVCRFYSPVFNTHFYTADAAECELVKHNPDWVYEKTAFPAYLPLPGHSCDAASVYRVYLAGDHRYTADAGVRDAMLARGWADEGVAFCAVRGGRDALATVEVQAYFPDPVPGCQAEGGDCIALDSLAPMPHRVLAYIPPDFIAPNPAYPPGVNALIGSDAPADLDTSQAGDPSAILKHSFTSPQGGLYLVGHDRSGGNYARITPMVQLPRVAVPPGDQRMFVWRTAADRELRVSANVFVGVVAQDGPGSHAYGATTLQFSDAVSGHTFLVTVQAYGTVPPGDFAAPDARSGEPIVSTVFRPDPAFGRVLSGSFIACKGDGSPCAPQSGSTPATQFTFSLTRADFQAALGRARTVDPALSGDAASYFLSRVAFNNETYLDARLGATVSGLTAEVWYVE